MAGRPSPVMLIVNHAPVKKFMLGAKQYYRHDQCTYEHTRCLRLHALAAVLYATLEAAMDLTGLQNSYVWRC